MSNWEYDSGGHKKDQKKYKENYDKIFGKPCPECGLMKGRHKMDCSMNWRIRE
jgi:hypothetical protein